MSTTNPSALLRWSLLSNAVFSTVSGICFLVASKPIANLIELEMPIILIMIGVSLLIFATGLVFNALRKTISPLEAWIAVILDFTWVIASGVVIFIGVLNATGNWGVAIIADVVLLLAILQFVGLRKLQKAHVVS